MTSLLGVFFHAIGGFAAGSFYIPITKIRDWAWESGWLVNGVTAWILMPVLLAKLTHSDFVTLLLTTPAETIFQTFAFGILWGIGGLTFGLSLRYLGVSLGTTVALGFCTAFGTLIPPLYEGKIITLWQEPRGKIIYTGIFLCLLGIGIAGRAGMLKEKELDKKKQKNYVKEFHFKKGFVRAMVSGILSACFAFGLASGNPIAESAIANGTHRLWQNSTVLVVLLSGGFVSNFTACVYLNIKNGSKKDYIKKGEFQKKNYTYAVIAGITWYLQFMFYGMGASYLGKAYEFAAWSLHMAFIILFSNFWGFYFKEWKGISVSTRRILFAGLLLLLLSVMFIGL